MQMDTNKVPTINPQQRLRIWYAFIVVVFAVFVVRLFYLQIIRHEHYKQAAQSDQIREYDVQPRRGTIYAQLNGKSVPIVLNQRLYTIFADPGLIKDPARTSTAVASLLNEPADKVASLLKTENTHYVILQKRVSPQVNDKLLALKYPGIASQETNYRVYPQGSIAAQVLGFVNDNGEGEYGLEQALDVELAGQKGRLKAVTDVHGVPLAANTNNLLVQPKAGDDVALTLDLGMQAQVEQIVQRAQQKFHSKNVSAIVLDTRTGAIKAMANYPTYDPSNYQQVDNAALFQNYAVSNPIEPGSITKVLTIADALNNGIITPDTSYIDPGQWTIDGGRILNVAEGEGRGRQDIRSLLNLSLNTGATWALMQMGGGNINLRGRQMLYDYFVHHYQLSKKTGIEQGYEPTGYVPEPQDNGAGINLTYANMSFGQAYSATALQMIAALSAIVNGGTYYQPHLVASTTTTDGVTTVQKPKIVKSDVVSTKTSSEMRSLLEYVVREHVLEGFPYMRFDSRYSVGGKTGTAQIANLNTHLYRTDAYDGTYMGYVGGDTPQYAIIVYNIEPHGYGGFAGSQTGQPIFADIAHMLIDNYGVTPKTH